MQTKTINISASLSYDEVLQTATGILHRGGLVAFPTETVYGLGADATNAAAVERVFEAKGRPADNPLIVHISDFDQINLFAKNVSDRAQKLVERFWPGPLTLVLERTSLVPDIVTAGLETVALRMPQHPITLELIRRFGKGIVGPSANRSGRPSASTAQHVEEDLQGTVDLILDAGPTTIGLESTVLDMTTDPPTLLRKGGLMLEVLRNVVGRIDVTPKDRQLVRSPGTRHRHYAPTARVMIIERENRKQYLDTIHRLTVEGEKVACIVHSEILAAVDAHCTVTVLSHSIENYASKYFKTLRELDRRGVNVILIEEVEEIGMGVAVMDRMTRASEASVSLSNQRVSLNII